ncbi:MAG: NAD-dependent epimerase/dehydratase family protein [Bacteroidales bacterium]
MILVTGATGLLGSYLLQSIISDGLEVKALKRAESSTKVTQRIFGYMSVYPEQLFQKVNWVDGDLLDIHSLIDALEDVDQVYHCAAVVSFDPRDKPEIIRANIEGTANLVNVCIDRGIKKFCHVSSIAVLGRADYEGLTDEQSQWKPSRNNSTYAISKYGAEREVWRGAEEGLNVVVVIPSVILGAGEPTRSSVRLFHAIRKHSRFYTGGMNGYVDVRDVVKVMRMLMEGSVTNKRFVVNSENLTYHELFTLVAEHCKTTMPQIRIPRVVLSFAWRIEKLRSKITRVPPLVTRETVRSSLSTYRYSSDEVKKTLNIGFIPVRQTIDDMCRLMKDEKL